MGGCQEFINKGGTAVGSDCAVFTGELLGGINMTSRKKGAKKDVNRSGSLMDGY